LDIGFGIWNTLIFTPDGHKGFINGTGTNTTKVLNLDAMTVLKTLTFDYPHGGFVTDDSHYLYLTCQTGNFINKIDITDTNFYDYTSIVLIPGQQVSTNSTLDPHQIEPSPDGSKYFVSCQKFVYSRHPTIASLL
jgi:DNA-binding beta-propeller fold protein YncE